VDEGDADWVENALNTSEELEKEESLWSNPR
jgi:hypothetical protein